MSIPSIPKSHVLSSLLEFSDFDAFRRLILNVRTQAGAVCAPLGSQPSSTEMQMTVYPQVLAFHLTPTQIHHLGDVFREVDKQQRGTISLEDLKVRITLSIQDADASTDSTSPARQDYLLNNQSELSIPDEVESEIKAIYDALTKNSANREINYNEFVAAVMWRRIQYDEEKVRAADTGTFVEACTCPPDPFCVLCRCGWCLRPWTCTSRAS
jgi:hypothetical protein